MTLDQPLHLHSLRLPIYRGESTALPSTEAGPRDQSPLQVKCMGSGLQMLLRPGGSLGKLVLFSSSVPQFVFSEMVPGPVSSLEDEGRLQMFLLQPKFKIRWWWGGGKGRKSRSGGGRQEGAQGQGLEGRGRPVLRPWGWPG